MVRETGEVEKKIIGGIVLKEIVEFMDANEGIEEYFIQDEVSEKFLHYFIKINKDTNGEVLFSTPTTKIKKNIVASSLLDIKNLDLSMKNKLKYMTYFQKGMHNKYLDKNKGLGGSSPYILTVKLLFDIKDKKELITSNIVLKKEDVNRINTQFEKAITYLEKVKIQLKPIFSFQKYNTEEELNNIKEILMNNLETILISDLKIKKKLKEKYNNQKNKKEVSLDIRIYLDVGLDKIIDFYNSFVKERAFLDKKNPIFKGNCSVCNTYSKELSLPYILNTGGDDFGMKLTMPLELINQVCKTCTLKLHKFKVMTDNNQLTKPFPLFIDNKNLFGKQKSILNDENKKKSYHEIIKSIYNTNPKDLKNYYLLNYYSESDNGWKLKIKDIDYIQNFKYMTEFKIYNFLEFEYGFKLNNFYERDISVFQFEKIINELVFEKNLFNKYFNDYKDIKITYWKIDSKNSNNILKNYLFKYRQAFYNFIYKSNQSSLKLIDFRSMMIEIIKDNIKHDDKDENGCSIYEDENGCSIYENEIKEKINLLLSLKHNFNKGEERLKVGEFKKLKEKMNEYLGCWQDKIDENDEIIYKKNEDGTFKEKDGKKITEREFLAGKNSLEDKNDELFAFLCGQMARFLLSKSAGKKENQKHSAFSGFTEWQTSRLLKTHILGIFNKYAHDLTFNKRNGKLENAMSIIFSYKDDLDMDSVMEYMIAGYFSNNEIY